MEKDLTVELDQLKKEFFDAENVHTTEKTDLIKIIHTMSTVLDMHPIFSDESRAIKDLFNAGRTFTSDQIEAVHQSLRKKIF